MSPRSPERAASRCCARARRAPLFPGARRRRRRRLRALCARPQRRPRLLAIAGAVDRRPPLQPALGRHRPHRLFGRRGHGADRGLSRASDRRGAEPDRGSVPVQRARSSSGRTGTWRNSAPRSRSTRALPFPVQVAIGRAITLWLLGEAMLALIVAVSLNRPPRSLRVMGLFALSGAFAAVTPLIANAAQLVTQPLLAIVFSSLCAALAQGGLWAIVYLMTGVALDWLAGRPPRWDAAWDHWRTGVVKGAIYGALFIGFILIAAFVLRIPGAPAFFSAFALGVGPVLGAALFPLAMTVVGSADGTPPFFGRLRARLPQSARARARRGRRTGARARLRGQSRRLRRRDALSRPGGDRRALLRRRRLRLRRLRRGVRRADPAAGLAPLCARGGLGRPRRRRARLVFRYRPAPRGDRQVLGLRRRQLPPERPAARRFHHLSDLQQVRRGQPRRGRRRRAAVLGRVGRGRHQLVAGGALVLDQLRAARRAPAAQPAADQNPPQPEGGRGRGRAGRARAALGPVDGADHQLVPAPVARSELVQPGRRGPHGASSSAPTPPRRRRRSGDSASSCSLGSSPTTGCAS